MPSRFCALLRTKTAYYRTPDGERIFKPDDSAACYTCLKTQRPVGPDGRTRYDSYCFSTITSRNAPEAHDCIFSWPRWCRGLIQSPSGRALISLDFAQQEYLIAGTLSKDPRLIADYQGGDVYLGLGKTLGLIPPDGDKRSHPKERSLCKSLTLAVNYGMAAANLARKIDRAALSEARAHADAVEGYRLVYEAMGLDKAYTERIIGQRRK